VRNENVAVVVQTQQGLYRVLMSKMDIEIAEISGPFKTFEEFTSFQLTSLAGLDKLLASKSK